MSATTKIKGFGWTLGVLFGLCAPVQAFAQAAPTPVQFTNSVYQEVEVKAADGTVTKKLVPAAHAAPGDEVIYEIAYRNDGKETATDIAIDNPLPDEVTFVSAPLPPSAVSVDGGKRFGPLAQLTVVEADGQTRPARAADITNLRWIVPSLAGGGSGKVTFRVRVK
jgi:uncharacterized repeat protein (TIGR01451 family)